jgi:hypothetical protein
MTHTVSGDLGGCGRMLLHGCFRRRGTDRYPSHRAPALIGKVVAGDRRHDLDVP